LEITSVFVFAIALAVASASLGPSVAALVSRVIVRGYRGVLPFLAAMWFGEAIWLALAVSGLSTLAATFQPMFLLIKWCGVAYLLYLAWKMWHAPTLLVDEGVSYSESGIKLFITGFAVTMGNPKTMMFYVALLPTIIDLNAVSVLGWAELTATMVIVVASIDIGWTLAAARARCLLTSRRAMLVANRTSAGIMAGAAATIATR
jgi:threonine/homoserine/homoserine lactone efflux protein